MKKDRLTAFLGLLGSKPASSQERSGWFVASCPMAPWDHDKGIDKNPSFAVKDGTGDAFANCFACGYHGPLSDIVYSMRHKNQQDHRVEVKWGEALALIEDAENDEFINLDSPTIEEMLTAPVVDLHLFPEWWLETFVPWDTAKFARDYLKERGVGPAMSHLLDVRADTKQRRVCFPIRDFKGRLVGFHGRAVDDGVEPRYRMYLQAGRNNPIVWYGESWVDLNKPIVVVEGPMDVASVRRVYRNVTSPLFANPSFEKISRMADALEWITLLDRGKGGDAGRAKMEAALKRDHVVVHLEPPEGRKDPGVCSVEELQELLAPYVSLDAVIM